MRNETIILIETSIYALLALFLRKLLTFPTYLNSAHPKLRLHNPTPISDHSLHSFRQHSWSNFAHNYDFIRAFQVHWKKLKMMITCE